MERANYKPTVNMLKKMYKWSNEYEKDKDKLLKDIELYRNKIMISKSARGILKEISI